MRRRSGQSAVAGPCKLAGTSTAAYSFAAVTMASRNALLAMLKRVASKRNPVETEEPRCASPIRPENPRTAFRVLRRIISELRSNCWSNCAMMLPCSPGSAPYSINQPGNPPLPPLPHLQAAAGLSGLLPLQHPAMMPPPLLLLLLLSPPPLLRPASPPRRPPPRRTRCKPRAPQQRHVQRQNRVQQLRPAAGELLHGCGTGRAARRPGAHPGGSCCCGGSGAREAGATAGC